MRSIYCLVPVFALGLAPPLLPQQAGPDSVAWGDTIGVAGSQLTGVYATRARGDAGCVLAMRELTGSRLHFRLDCNRGAPSYNMGVAHGILAIAHGEATYRLTEFGGVCELRFRFETSVVRVTQTGTDGQCGFGGNVYADGVYRLKNRRVRAADLEAAEPS